MLTIQEVQDIKASSARADGVGNKTVKMLLKHIEEVEALTDELIEHLDYCGWGDAWERECSENLQKKARAFTMTTP